MIVVKLMVVKMLFIVDDLLTPADSKIDAKIIIANAKKSSCLVMKLMCIGSSFWNRCDIRLSVNSSIYALRPRAIHAAPNKKNPKQVKLK